MPAATAIVCEILAPHTALADALAEVANMAARSIGQPVIVKTHVIDIGGRDEVVITLHLPAALAAGQHPVWCLACRLACFCPQARVSVLIHGEAVFTPPPLRARRTESA